MSCIISKLLVGIVSFWFGWAMCCLFGANKNKRG